MRTSELLSVLPSTQDHLTNDREVTAVCADSRLLQMGCVYVAVRGTKVDGHQFLAEASAKGAIALVVEDPTFVPAEFQGAVVVVENTRDALNKLSAQFFGHASQKLFCVGATGTNGKTTVTHMVEAVLNHAGKPTGVIGTIDHHLGAKVWPTSLTTPDPLSFQQRLSEFVADGARAVALEVTSIGLDQRRTDEVAYDVALFTNLTRDHLDVHKDMETYYLAKRRLFFELLAGSSKPRPTAVINGDDEYGRRLLRELRQELESHGNSRVAVWSYGRKQKGVSATAPDLAFEILQQDFSGTRFKLTSPIGVGEFHLRLIGAHMVYNAVAAIGAALVAGVDLATIAQALDSLAGVKGRLEAVPNKKGLHVFVDYAHTDDAIATVLRYLGEIRQNAGLQARLITVFGCGGDRDRGKRPLMMRASLAGSDAVFVTSDNPRTEDPQAIIRDIVAEVAPSLMGQTVFVEVDRRLAIRKALEYAAPGDVVVIAGKGHEDYQIIGTVKHPFSDVAVVAEVVG